MDPGNLEESERKQRGIKLLCTTLRQSLDAFTADAGRLPASERSSRQEPPNLPEQVQVQYPRQGIAAVGIGS